MARELTPDDKLMLELQEKTTRLDIESWLDDDFLSTEWWIQVVLLVIP